MEQKKLKFDELIGKKFTIEIGSGGITTTWDENTLKNGIANAIMHERFDKEFYYNWTDNGKEYLDVFRGTTLKDLMSNLDDTLDKYFVLKKYPNKEVLFFNEKNKDYIDNWFINNKTISSQLKKDYQKYREKYAGVSLQMAKGGLLGGFNYSIGGL